MMNMSEKVKKVDISHRTIIFSILFLIGLWFLYQIREILLALFISIILMGSLNPTIQKLEKIGIHRIISILIIYLLILAILCGSIAGLVPALVEQTDSLVRTLLELEGKLNFWGIPVINLGSELQELGGLPTQIIKAVVVFASNLVSLLTILIITFYLLLERRNLDKYLTFLFKSEGHQRANKLVDRLEERLGGWVRTQFFLMTVIGLLTYIGLKILGYKYALPLSIVAGLLEIIVYVGPLFSAVLIGLVGFITSPLLGILGTVWLIIVQQLQSNVLVPVTIKKSLGVNPLITILSLAIGFEIAGVKGAILSIPAYLTLEVFFLEFLPFKKEQEQGE